MEYGNEVANLVQPSMDFVRRVLFVRKVEKILTAQKELPGVQSGDEMNKFDTSVIIKPRRVYKCRNRIHESDMFLARKDVKKDEDGNYHCRFCDDFVEDVTDTETGSNLMEVIGL